MKIAYTRTMKVRLSAQKKWMTVTVKQKITSERYTVV